MTKDEWIKEAEKFLAKHYAGQKIYDGAYKDAKAGGFTKTISGVHAFIDGFYVLNAHKKAVAKVTAALK